MTKTNIITWVILILLTVVAGFVSNTSATYVIPVILILSALKFIGVAYNFMELRKAHLLWKALILGFAALFCGINLFLLAM